MSEIYDGPCAGGPHNGRRIKSPIPRITIPIPPRMVVRASSTTAPLKFRSCEYRFHLLLQMWIWQGPWPP